LRAGYPQSEFNRAPELTGLRTDPRYQRLLDGSAVRPPNVRQGPAQPVRKAPVRRKPPG